MASLAIFIPILNFTALVPNPNDIEIKVKVLTNDVDPKTTADVK